MKHLILITLLFLLLSSCGDDHGGTGTDVQSGTIAGRILNGFELYEEPVIVELYERTTRPSVYLEEQHVDNGQFSFGTLKAGDYKVKVLEVIDTITKDCIIIAETNMDIIEGQNFAIDIYIDPVVTQTIPDTIVYNDKTITILNIVFFNSKVDMSVPGEITLTFADHSSQFIQLEYLNGDSVERIDANWVKQSDNSFAIEIIE